MECQLAGGKESEVERKVVGYRLDLSCSPLGTAWALRGLVVDFGWDIVGW